MECGTTGAGRRLVRLQLRITRWHWAVALLGGLLLAANTAAAQELSHDTQLAGVASLADWRDGPDDVRYAALDETTAAPVDAATVSSTDPAENSRLRTTLAFAFAGLFSFLAAMACIPTGLRHRKLATLTKEARRVPAVIRSSKVGVSTEQRDLGEFIFYTPMVKYTYAYEGADYQGEQLRSGDTRTQVKKEAEDISAKYPEGAKVSAYVNPRDPGEATLELYLPRYRPFLPLAAILGAAGAVLVLISLVFLL